MGLWRTLLGASAASVTYLGRRGSSGAVAILCLFPTTFSCRLRPGVAASRKTSSVRASGSGVSTGSGERVLNAPEVLRRGLFGCENGDMLPAARAVPGACWRLTLFRGRRRDGVRHGLCSGAGFGSGARLGFQGWAPARVQVRAAGFAAVCCRRLRLHGPSRHICAAEMTDTSCILHRSVRAV